MTTAIALPISAFQQINFGLSEEAGEIRRLITDASEFPGSITIGEPKRVAKDALKAVYTVVQTENWDGEGAARVEPSTFDYAKQFLDALPSSIPVPEIVADIDGEILFEWNQCRRQNLSVSVGRDGTLTYAGLFGYRKKHGVEYIQEGLPMDIADCLKRLTPSNRS